MLITSRVAYIEMPRTGSTHIVGLLQRVLGGTRIGMHQPADGELLASQRAFLGSIRNPWAWYLSQWSLGCNRSGLVHQQVTRPRRAPSKQPRSPGFDPTPWLPTYADPEGRDVAAFRTWLRLLSTPEQLRAAFPLHFGRSDLHHFAGYYTYRFAKLFCTHGGDVDTPGALPDLATLAAFVDRNLYITHMVRTETLARDLEAALRAIGYDLTPDQRAVLRTSPPPNRSKRALPLEAYFDAESVALVAERDRLIVDRFGYSWPPPSWQAPALRSLA